MRAIIHSFSTGLGAVILFMGIASASSVYSSGTQPFSKYGQIQNVQNYSSNPFWTPNSPYNQRMPQPVYAQGPGLNTGDCQRTVSNLIAAECGLRNNCVGVRLMDIRPTIMTQLSRLPGHNYATACGGYIDTIFNEYVSNNAIADGRNTGTSLPTYAVPNPNATQSQQKIQIKNPYEQKLPTWNGQPWAQEMIERKQELDQLQSQNGVGSEKIVNAEFPTTYADLSFTERMANEAAGFEPWKDAKAYLSMNIESEEDYLQRKSSNLEARQKMDKATMSFEEYCKKYPGDTPYCKGEQPQVQISQSRQDMIEKIAAALKEAKK